jgi:hypothetical protein
MRAVIDSDLAVVVVASVFALSVGAFVLREPVFVDEVSVTNSSEYDIGVQVSGDDPDGWMALGTASEGSTTTTVDVIDQGEVWVFRFTAQGRDGGELRVARSDLEQAGWTVTVPDEVIQQLRDLGAPPSP